MFLPSYVISSIAGKPSSVPGILIMRFGRSTRSQYSRACSIVRWVSKARSGSTSKEMKPSWPSVSSCTGRRTSAASWMSTMASAW